MERQQVEVEMLRKQMQADQDRFDKKMAEQKKQYESKVKDDQRLESVR